MPSLPLPFFLSFRGEVVGVCVVRYVCGRWNLSQIDKKDHLLYFDNLVLKVGVLITSLSLSI